MAILKKAIKDNVMSTESKYKYDGEKVGEVIEANEAENRCTVHLVTRDGITSTEYNVVVDKHIKKFPKTGDFVKVKEQMKKFTIVEIYSKTDFNTNLNGDIYPTAYGSSINGFVGIS